MTNTFVVTIRGSVSVACACLGGRIPLLKPISDAGDALLLRDSPMVVGGLAANTISVLFGENASSARTDAIASYLNLHARALAFSFNLDERSFASACTSCQCSVFSFRAVASA